MLAGRLGLETARIPYKDRHGLVWLSYGALSVRDGTLEFLGAAGGEPGGGLWDIPFQTVTAIILGPGTSVTQDALRLLARHGTGLMAAGADGVRFYASMPFGPDRSDLARRQAEVWFDGAGLRIDIARRMYAWRLGEIFPATSLDSLRGREGARMKECYRLMAQKYNITWQGRNYDRANPGANDPINNAINHASVAVVATAQLAVAAAGAIPQLGFIHEDSGIAFCLDIADLYRHDITHEAAFSAVAELRTRPGDLERTTRQKVGRLLREKQVLPKMIEQINELFSDASRRR